MPQIGIFRDDGIIGQNDVCNILFNALFSETLHFDVNIGLGIDFHALISVDVINTEMSKIIFYLGLMKLNNLKSECHLAKYLDGRYILLSLLVYM